MAKKVDTNVQIRLKGVELAFTQNLFEAREPDEPGAKPKFQSTVLVKKTDKSNTGTLSNAIKQSMAKMWGDKPPKLSEDRKPVRDGDEKEYDGFDGKWFFTASNTKRPKIVRRDGKTPITEADDMMYGGAVVNADVSVYCIDHKKFGKRVCVALNGLQFVADGERYGGGSVNPEFEALEDEDGADTSGRNDFLDEEAPF